MLQTKGAGLLYVYRQQTSQAAEVKTGCNQPQTDRQQSKLTSSHKKYESEKQI